MSTFTKTEVLGIIGKDAQVRRIGEKDYISFAVSVGNGKNPDGTWRDSTWFDVLYSYNPQTQAWLLDELKSKATVHIEGRVSARAFTAKDGTTVANLNLYAQSLNPVGMVQRAQTQATQQPAYPQNGYTPQAPQGFAPQQPQMPYQGGYGQQYPQNGYAAQPQQAAQMPPQGGYAPQQPNMYGVQGADDSDQPF